MLAQSITLSTSEPVQCERGDAQFQIYGPQEHMAQSLHQRLVLDITCAVYIATTETGILYIVVIKCPTAVQMNCYGTVKALAGLLVTWA